jgi:hypothetical protein
LTQVVAELSRSERGPREDCGRRGPPNGGGRGEADAAAEHGRTSGRWAASVERGTRRWAEVGRHAPATCTKSPARSASMRAVAVGSGSANTADIPGAGGGERPGATSSYEQP